MFQCRTQHCVCRDQICDSGRDVLFRFQCRTQHCVCRDSARMRCAPSIHCFNAARSIVCVETLLMKTFRNPLMSVSMPHAALCVSRHGKAPWYHRHLQVSMPHAALCVSRQNAGKCREFCEYVSMPHAALCVSRLDSLRWVFMNNPVSMPHAALCVSRHCVPQPLSRAG